MPSPKPDWHVKTPAEQREDRINRVRELVGQGYALADAARRVGVAERTARDYLKAGAFDPSWRRRPSRGRSEQVDG